MAKIIYSSRIEDLLLELKNDFKVVAPIVKNSQSASGRVAFSEYKKGDELDFSYPTTILPPKEWLLPPCDTFFEYEGKKIIKPDHEKTIIFGVSIEDLEGIYALDTVFKKPILDKAYFSRRENMLIVGVDRFSPPKDIPFDLYLQKIASDTYSAYAKTLCGRKLLKKVFFENHAIKIPKVTSKKDMLFWDRRLPGIIEKSKNHPIWNELAEICFGCGICSYTCPLCYCFETEDKVELLSKEKFCGSRCRTWDSCMLSHFAETTGHNFRPELKDRIYNWFYHKFVRMPKEYGFPGCVDCNRCIVFCPAKINYRTVLMRLIEDSEKGGRR